jgi:hypothetical protein
MRSPSGQNNGGTGNTGSMESPHPSFAWRSSDLRLHHEPIYLRESSNSGCVTPKSETPRGDDRSQAPARLGGTAAPGGVEAWRLPPPAPPLLSNPQPEQRRGEALLAGLLLGIGAWAQRVADPEVAGTPNPSTRAAQHSPIAERYYSATTLSAQPALAALCREAERPAVRRRDGRRCLLECGQVH